MQREVDDYSLNEEHWATLLLRIKNGACTPFLGAGACYNPDDPHSLPLGGQIAKQWAEEHNFPFSYNEDLPRVAQYLALTHSDQVFPKTQILETWFNQIKLPDFQQRDNPHGVLAKLPLPVYITTNYDHLMSEALNQHDRKAIIQMSQWNKYMQVKYQNDYENIEPSIQNPLVYHLHGFKADELSLVLTEDDYLDFLINLSRDDKNLVISERIEEALTITSLLFIGYSLQDWDFRFIYRGLLREKDPTLQMLNIAVQLPVKDKPRAQLYLKQYFEHQKVRVYWGTAKEFVAELLQRWEEYNNE